MTIACRWLDQTDLTAWRQLRSEALRLCPDAFLTTREEFEAQSDDHVQAQLAQGRVVGAWRDGQLLGSVAYLRKSHATAAHRAELAAVYVSLKGRGKGLADAMMDHVEARARRESVTQLELLVWDGNAAAISFYQRRGFEVTGRIPRAVVKDGRVFDDLLLVHMIADR